MFDILAFSPHPDDVELGCGGTILLSAQQGMRVAVADLSEGERSSRGTPEKRMEERKRATELLQIHDRYSLYLPDTGIGGSPDHCLAVIGLIRRAKPQIVLAPYWEDRHPDHEAAGRLVREACFYAGVASVGEGEPFRPDLVYFYMSHSPFVPTFIIDITPVWEQKMEVIRAYGTQFGGDGPPTHQTALSDPAFLRHHESRSTYFGAMIGAAHGEPFFSRGPLGLTAVPGIGKTPVDDRWTPSYRCF